MTNSLRETPREALDRAIAALNRRDADLPVEAVDRALRTVPEDPRLWHVKGLIHRELDQRELAIPALRKAAELAPNEPLIAHGYAQTLLEAGQPSVEAFARAMKLDPTSPAVVRGMIAALAAASRLDEAIEGLEMALRRSPLWTEGHALLASLRWSNGEREGFDRSFDAAIAQHPNSLDLRRAQVNELIQAEQWEEALRKARDGKALPGQPAMFLAYETFIHAEAGDRAAADEGFAQLPSWESPDIDLWRVRHLLRTGRVIEAVEVLDYWLATPDQQPFWPYAASAWRLADDPRSAWLEGESALVGVYDLRDRLPSFDNLGETLRRIHTARGELLAQSVRGGTQTDGHLFHRTEPEIVELREVIRSVVEDHARQLPPLDPRHPLISDQPRRIEFSGAWSVRLQAGGHHANHVHPLGWLSSAFYVVLPNDLGRDQAGWFTLGQPQAQLGLDLPPTRVIEPKPGRLVLFPSWMWHGTRPFAEGERITVAFDVAK